jgi:hypothetical protein
LTPRGRKHAQSQFVTGVKDWMTTEDARPFELPIVTFL